LAFIIRIYHDARYSECQIRPSIKLKISTHDCGVNTDFFYHDATAPSGPRSPHYQGFTITLRHTTLGRTPLDECSARRERPLSDNTQHSLQTFYITRSVNKVMRLIQYNSVITFKIQIELVPFKIVPLGGYTPPETLFPIFVAKLVVANRNRF